MVLVVCRFDDGHNDDDDDDRNGEADDESHLSQSSLVTEPCQKVGSNAPSCLSTFLRGTAKLHIADITQSWTYHMF